jgi:hypothetical protein
MNSSQNGALRNHNDSPQAQSALDGSSVSEQAPLVNAAPDCKNQFFFSSRRLAMPGMLHRRTGLAAYASLTLLTRISNLQIFQSGLAQ